MDQEMEQSSRVASLLDKRSAQMEDIELHARHTSVKPIHMTVETEGGVYDYLQQAEEQTLHLQVPLVSTDATAANDGDDFPELDFENDIASDLLLNLEDGFPAKETNDVSEVGQDGSEHEDDDAFDEEAFMDYVIKLVI